MSSICGLYFELGSWRGLLDTTLCDKVCQWLAKDQWFSPGTPVSSTNEAYRYDIIEILMKVALSIITLSYCVLKLLFLLLCLPNSEPWFFNLIYILFNDCRPEVVVHVIDIDGIDDHHCLNFLFSFLVNNLHIIVCAIKQEMVAIFGGRIVWTRIVY
jgi:hypothetical protein